MLEDVPGVVILEGAVPRGMKQHEDGHHFAQAQGCGPVAFRLLADQQMFLPVGLEYMAKVVDVAKNR
jgi:hypothetical protein